MYLMVPMIPCPNQSHWKIPSMKCRLIIRNEKILHRNEIDLYKRAVKNGFKPILPSFFFFGSDPKPDDPDVIDESSRTPPIKPGNVLTLAVDGITPLVRDIVAPGNPDDGVFSTPTNISLPKSSRDANFLLFIFDVGLQRTK